MKDKNIEDFKKKAKEKNIRFWKVHNCAFCDYPCGFAIDGNEVSYDSGCDCTNSRVYEPRTWKDIVEAYNSVGPEHIKEVNEFWGFGEITCG